LAKPKERTLKRPEEALHPERFQIGIGGEIISEWWAISFRNHGRFEIGMMGDFARNQHRPPETGIMKGAAQKKIAARTRGLGAMMVPLR
jgi:hypothetical protein